MSGTKLLVDIAKPGDTGGYGDDPYVPAVLKSALRLAQMTYNHYSIIISADWTTLRAWGPCSTYGRVALANTNSPSTCSITWLDPAKPESIIKIYSNGNRGGFGANGITIFRTEEDNLYGTGNGDTNLLNNNGANSLNTFRHIDSDVTDFCCADQDYMLYVKSTGRVYGLGSNLNAGFGFTLANRRALSTSLNEANYLGIANGSKVFCASPSNRNKSFVLLTDGRVMACGYNTSGCLGVDSNDAIIYAWQFVKTPDPQNPGQNIDLGDVVDIVTTNEVYVGGADGAIQGWAGGSSANHMTTYFLTRTGNVYTCGSNNFGQLGLNIAVNQTRNVATITPVANATNICTTAGGTSVLVTTTNNQVFTWGNNQWGQLGLADLNNRSTPTQAVFPDFKINMIHGGGMYGRINGAFLIVCDNGRVYGAGYNRTYALGITNNGVPLQGPITSFTRNEYFGEDPPQAQDPFRYPIDVTGHTVTSGSPRIAYTNDFETKINVPGPGGNRTENVYIRVGMRVEGTGIPASTYVKYIDRTNNYLVLTNNATQSGNNITLKYINIIKVYQADLCGYGTEMAQKTVAEDGTLYMSGWNQHVDPYWNFNWYYGDQNVAIPTYFDAAYGAGYVAPIVWKISGLPAGTELAFADGGTTTKKIPYSAIANGFIIPARYTYKNGLTLATDIAFVDSANAGSTIRKITYNGVTADLGLWGSVPWISLDPNHASLAASANLKTIIKGINQPGIYNITIDNFVPVVPPAVSPTPTPTITLTPTITPTKAQTPTPTPTITLTLTPTPTKMPVIWRFTNLGADVLAYADAGNTDNNLVIDNTTNGWIVPPTYTYTSNLTLPTDIAFKTPAAGQNPASGSLARYIVNNLGGNKTGALGVFNGYPWLSVNADHALLAASTALKTIINSIKVSGTHNLTLYPASVFNLQTTTSRIPTSNAVRGITNFQVTQSPGAVGPLRVCRVYFFNNENAGNGIINVTINIDANTPNAWSLTFTATVNWGIRSFGLSVDGTAVPTWIFPLLQPAGAATFNVTT